jgi:hypothetical protein
MDDRFLLICRQNYFDKVTPLYLEFAGFLQEGQYLIALWAAHMMVEYGSPEKELRTQAHNVIKQYTNNPLEPTIAEQERDWIETYIGSL